MVWSKGSREKRGRTVERKGREKIGKREKNGEKRIFILIF